MPCSSTSLRVRFESDRFISPFENWNKPRIEPQPQSRNDSIKGSKTEASTIIFFKNIFDSIKMVRVNLNFLLVFQTYYTSWPTVSHLGLPCFELRALVIKVHRNHFNHGGPINQQCNGLDQ